MQRAMTNQEE